MKLLRDWRPSWWKANLIVAVAYLLTAYVGDESGLVLFGNLTLFWPPSGIALAGVLLLGYRVWPAVLLGSFVGNLIAFHHPNAIALSIAVNAAVGLGSAVQALVGGYFIRRACKDRNPLDAPEDVIKFIGLAGMLSSTVSALIATPALTAGGFSAWENLGPFAWTWWLGDATGILVVTPLLLVWLAKPRPRLPSVVETLALVAGVVLAGQLVFGVFGGPPHHLAVEHLFLPVLIWASLRFGPHGAVTTISSVYLMAMIATPHGRGPFATAVPEFSVLLLQAFLGSLVLTTLILSAILTQRRNAEAELQRAHDGLERRVVERTQDLGEANRRLLQERNFSSAILEVAGALLVVLDREGRILAFNRACEQLTGATQGEVKGQLFAKRFVLPADAQLFEEALQRAVASGEPSTNESGWIGRGGHVRIVEWNAAVLREPSGLVEFVIISGGDITDRKEMEQARQRLFEQESQARLEAQASIRQRDDFIAIASHELRSPLAPLRLHLDVLKRHLKGIDDPKLGRLVGAMENSDQQVDRLSRLIDHLLDVSRITAGRLVLELDEVELSGLVNNVVDQLRSELASSKCLVAISTRAPAPVAGRWDPIRLEQVVTNLLTNAMKYGAGKPIEIEIGARGGVAKLSVCDHGIGIAQAEQEKIFNRFERAAPLRQYGGLGLGLFIACEIVAAHGGTISVQSAPGQGAVFSVDLPMHVEAGAWGSAQPHH